MAKKTLVLGASPNKHRFSNQAVKSLVRHGFDVIALGIRDGEIAGVKIQTVKQKFDNIHTVNIYLNPKNQVEYYQYIISLEPKRVIINPGAGNIEFGAMLIENGIEVLDACSLVMLNTGSY